MKKIAILSSSVRTGRLSPRVALYVKKYLEANHPITAEIIDLADYGFPLFEERLAYLKNPSPELLEFTGRLFGADGLVIVSPVYNAGFPAALKNVIDLYYSEWMRYPVGIVSVTSGKVPGIATVQQLQTLMLKMGSVVAAPWATAINVAEVYSETGEADAEGVVRPMLETLLWLIDKTGGERKPVKE